MRDRINKEMSDGGFRVLLFLTPLNKSNSRIDIHFKRVNTLFNNRFIDYAIICVFVVALVMNYMQDKSFHKSCSIYKSIKS